MMKNILCAGVGGQGVLTLGMVLAEAAANQGKYVTWLPEYGSEMRGGSASCKIKIGDEPIISPFMEEIDILAALHKNPLEKYAELVEEGGMIMVESSLVHDLPDYPGRTVVRVPAVELAEKIANPRGMSAVMVGAIIAASEILPFDAALEAVSSYYAYKNLPVEINKQAFIEGYQYIKSL